MTFEHPETNDINGNEGFDVKKFLGLEEEPVESYIAIVRELEKLSEERQDNPEVLEHIQTTFNEQGLFIDAKILPAPLLIDPRLEDFTKEDWEAIRSSKAPILELISTVNFYRAKASFEYGSGWGGSPSRWSNEDEKELRSLPLIHGTTQEAVKTILEVGHIVSNRELFELSEKEAIDFHGSNTGATTTWDRLLGLDRYIFADFGRPHMYRSSSQPEAYIVLEPEVMQQEGVFITENDILDCDSLDQYMLGLSTPRLFYETALMRIRCMRLEDNSLSTIPYFSRGADANFNNLGSATFSTWEVKLPRTETRFVRRIVVKDKSYFETLKKQYGDDYEIVFDDRVMPGQYNSLQETKKE